VKPRWIYVVSLLSLLGAGRVWPDSSISRVSSWGVFALIVIDMLIKVRSGYLRRRPHWTRESWQRYVIAFVLVVGATLVGLAMAKAVDLRVPITGIARSTARTTWVLTMMVFLFSGAIGIGIVVDRLAAGDPARQFGGLFARRNRTD